MAKKLPLYSHQGHIIRHVKVSEWNGLAQDPAFEVIEGRLTKLSFQQAREDSPSALTCSDIKLIAGEYGDPKPEEMRRDGYIDPVEAAKQKLEAWNKIPSASQQARQEISAKDFEHLETSMTAIIREDGTFLIHESNHTINFA